MSLFNKLLDTTIGSVLKTAGKFGVKSTAKILTPTRLRGAAVGAGIYYGGNYLATKLHQNMVAEYGENTYANRYQSGENTARKIIAGSALYNVAVGGVLGRSATKGVYNLSKNLLRDRSPIGPMRPLRQDRINMRNYLNRSRTKGDRFKARVMKTKKFATSNFGILSGVGIAGVSFGYMNANRKPLALEAGNTEFFGTSSVQKQNFNTAGLVQAIHDRRKRQF